MKKSGAFGDWAQNYYDLGFSVLPVEPDSKLCRIKGWTDKFSKRFPTEEEQEEYLTKYWDYDIGLATGGSSGIIAIDFDYENMADASAIESLVIGALPLTPCIKKGAKGWTRFYRDNGDIKNAGIDRFGTRMIDVLATGRLTVLPPSNHKKEGVTYRWIGSAELLEVEANELPYVTKKHIEQLKEISTYDNSIFEEALVSKQSRHDTVVGFILQYSDSAIDLEDLIQKTIDYDSLAHKNDPKGPYLNDKKYLDGQSSYEFTKKLAERICTWKTKKRADQGIKWEIGKYPRLHSEGKKSSTNYEDFKSFFEFNYPDVRFDKIRRTSFFYSQRLKKWEPIDNIREVIESEASDAGLSPSYVNRHLQRWLQGLEPRLTIDIPRWNGRDYIAGMVRCLKIKNIDNDLAIELFKHWGANIFRRLNDKHKREQNAMIILKGGQGIGKDSWINFFLGGFGPYFSEIELQDRKIENYQTVSDLLVANIPEFDETHRVAVSTLKSVITSPGATFRAAYARKSDFVPFYTSYISSCNFDHILRDSSGNRRFMIFEVESIDWRYASSEVDQAQIIAQFEHLYKINYKASPEALKASSEYIKDHTPVDIDDLIVEEVDEIIYQLTPLNNSALRWTDIAVEVDKVAKRYRVSIRRIQSLLKKNDLWFKTMEGHFYRSKRVKTQASIIKNHTSGRVIN